MKIQSAKQQSFAFLAASERCLTERRCGSETLAIILTPGIVCSLFAIEVGLKYLIMLGGKGAKGHHLASLYEKVEADYKIKICTKVGMPKSDFDHELSNINKAFEQWRYHYEYDELRINFSFLNKLSSALQSVVRNA